MIAKALLFIAILLLLVWLLRGGGRSAGRHRAQRPPAPPATPPPQAMTRCVHCGLHLPAAEAVRGRADSVYCSDAHRHAAEGSDAGA